MARPRKLTRSQLERIRADLLVRQRLLHQDARVKLDEVNEEEATRGGDEADRAVVSFEHEMAVGAAARESRELQLIEIALAKLDSGRYAVCEECGGAIALARLKALPFAEHCIDCQERLEQEGMLADSVERRSRS